MDWQHKDSCCLFCSLASHLLPAATGTAAVQPGFSHSCCCLTIQRVPQKLEEVFRAPLLSPPPCIYMTCICIYEDPCIKHIKGLGPCKLGVGGTSKDVVDALLLTLKCHSIPNLQSEACLKYVLLFLICSHMCLKPNRTNVSWCCGDYGSTRLLSLDLGLATAV